MITSHRPAPSTRRTESGERPTLEKDRLRRMTRLLRILGLLQSKRDSTTYTLGRLADICGCCRKTIQRDLDYCEELGIPVTYDPIRKTYFLSGDVPFKLLDIEFIEATALALVEASAGTARGLDLQRSIDTAFQKIMGLVPEEVAERMAASRATLLSTDMAKRDYSKAPIMPLLEACRRQETVEIDYESRSSPRRVRRIEPYHIAFLDGFWMVIARDPERGEVRNFALDRIHFCHFCRPARRFQRPADWSLAEFLAGTVGVLHGEKTDIVLRFHPDCAPWLQGRRFRFPNTMTNEADGSVTLRGTVAGLVEIAREVLHWGRYVTVLEPEALRRKVADEARAIAALYETTAEKP